VNDAVAEADHVESLQEAETPNLFESWEWVAPGIMLIKDAFSWGPDAIQQAEKLAKEGTAAEWKQTLVYTATPEGRLGHASPDRTCETISISTTPELKDLDTRVFETAKGSGERYMREQEYALFNQDSGYDLLRYGPTQRFVLHVDCKPNAHSMTSTGLPTSQRQLSWLAYLNDNYKGGEVSFPAHGVSLRPPAGSVLMFPSQFSYPHEAKPVVSGVRYVTASWFFWVEPTRG